MTSLGAKAMGGVAAAAVALGVAQLVGVAFGPEADVRTAVGASVIELTPGPVKDGAIDTFGTADKLALTVMVLMAIAVIAASSSVPRRAGSSPVESRGGEGVELWTAGTGPR